MSTYGLVLGGGGSRGSYELGVWKALNELNIEISAIVGTSIGSINGALFIQGDFESTKNLWFNLDFYKCFTTKEEKLTYKDKLVIKDIPYIIKNIFQHKGIDITPMKNLLENYLNEEIIRSSPIDFGMVTFSLSNLKPIEIFKEAIPQGQLIDYLMASSCFPGFKFSEIQGEKFIDGGIYSNIPAEMLLEKNVSSIITVNIHGPGKVKRFPKEKKNIIEIECSENLGPLFHFEKKTLLRNMEIGYLDTLKKFNKLIGNHYYFYDEKILDNSPLSPLGNFEFELILKCINFKVYSKRIFLMRRVLNELCKYTQKVPDGNTTMLTALEITAEFLQIERARVYHYEELLNLILEKALTTELPFEKYAELLKSSRGLTSITINFSIINMDENKINILRTLALTSPRQFIATIFISLMKHRTKLSSPKYLI
jgi:NTE family protein